MQRALWRLKIMKNTETKAMLINGSIKELTFEDLKQKFSTSLTNLFENDVDKPNFNALDAVVRETFDKYDDPTMEVFKLFMLNAIANLYHYSLEDLKQMNEDQLKLEVINNDW